MSSRLGYLNGMVDVAAVDSIDAVKICTLAAHRAKIIELFSALAAGLERRRLADTVLEGRCSAAEKAWAVALMRDDFPSSPADACFVKKQFGFAAFLTAAKHIMWVLSNPTVFVEECSASQFESFAQFIVHATDMMQLPRQRHTTFMCAEVGLANSLFDYVPELERQGLDASLVQLLADAWERLKQSGVIEIRGLLSENALLKANAGDDMLDQELYPRPSYLRCVQLTCAAARCRAVACARVSRSTSSAAQLAAWWCTAAASIKCRTGRRTKRLAKPRARRRPLRTKVLPPELHVKLRHSRKLRF